MEFSISRRIPALILGWAILRGIAEGGVGRWTTSGPEGGNVFSLAVAPADSRVLYAGAFEDIFRSADGAEHWSWAGEGLPARAWIFEIVVDPRISSTAYALTCCKGLFKTTDGGGGWTESNAGLQSNEGIISPRGLAVDPSNPEVLYLTTVAGLFKSLSGGESWLPLRNGLASSLGYPAPLSPIIVDPFDPAVLYVGVDQAGEFAGVLRSLDGGESWASVNDGLFESVSSPRDMEITALAGDPLTPGTLYAGTRSGRVFRSADRGGNWTLVHEFESPDPSIVQLAVDPRDSGTLYASVNLVGLAKSADRGATWELLETGAFLTYSFAIDPGNSRHLYAAAGFEGVLRSRDGGAIWTTANGGLIATGIAALAAAPTDPTRLYAGAEHFFTSPDAGESWLPSDGGPTFVTAIAAHPSASTCVYAGTGGGGVFASCDSGTTWEQLFQSTSPFSYYPSIAVLAVDPLRPATVYLATRGAGRSIGYFYSTTDSGRTWVGIKIADGLPSSYVTSLAIDPRNSDVLYAGTQGLGLYKSGDGGSTWLPLSIEVVHWYVTAIAIDPSDPQTIYVSSSAAVLRSNDAGGEFAILGSGLPALKVSDLAVDPTRPGSLYAATEGGGVFVSRDRGVSWVPMNEGLSKLSVLELAIDHSGQALHAGTAAGVFDFELLPDRQPVQMPRNRPPTRRIGPRP